MTTHESAAAKHEDVRVELYVREGCSLCPGARQIVAEVCGRYQVDWREIDLLAGSCGPGADPQLVALAKRWSDMVPVVVVDGTPQGFWHVDAQRLDDALAAGPGGERRAAAPGPHDGRDPGVPVRPRRLRA